ncbi:unnamed protein product, partial [Rotaria sp. Silwood1]
MPKQASTHFLVIPKEPITQLSAATPSNKQADQNILRSFE